MADNPLELIVRSQKAATTLMADTINTMLELGKAGASVRPDEVLQQVTALASAMSELVGSTAQPLEFLLNGQRQLADSMVAYAVLQRQLADVVESAATSHLAIVEALELMTNPVIGVAKKLRHEEPEPKRATRKPAAKKATGPKG